MKKFLFLLLLPLFAHAQTVPYCGPYTNSPNIVWSNISNATISGLQLGNSSNIAISLTNCHNIHITKCNISNVSKNFAIFLSGCSVITIDSCDIRNVGFGVYAVNGCTVIKVNANQFRDINGISVNSLGHAVQFNTVNSGGNQINYNIIENVLAQTDTTRHPHDLISVYASNGLLGDSIQIIGNKIRYGQVNAWPNSSFTGCGIGLGDNFGSFQVCRGNILVTTGIAGIQVAGNGTSIKVDHNVIFGAYTPVSHQAITILDANVIYCGYNRTNWTNYNNYNVLLADGETQYYLGNPPSPTPVGFGTNVWKDATVTAAILPSNMFASCVVVQPPNISYNPSSQTINVGQTLTNMSPNSTGGSVVSYSISPTLPSNITLNTANGLISGSGQVASATQTYTVTANNSAGSSTAPVTLTVNAIAAPNISYSVSTIVFQQNQQITPLVPTDSGGPVVSYTTDVPLPAGLSISSANGQITGICSTVTAPYTVTVKATNQTGNSTWPITLSVTPAPTSHFILINNKILTQVY